MTVEYDCGMVLDAPIVLKPGQLLIANAALGDQMLLMMDAQHDTTCTVCRVSPEEAEVSVQHR